MDETGLTYEELKKKLAEAEKTIAALRGNGHGGNEDSDGDVVKKRRPAVPAERELIEAYIQSEENFRHTMDACPLGIRVSTLKGEMSYANRAMLDITGYGTFEELNAVDIRRLYTPESYASHLERKERRDSHQPVPSEYEVSIIRRDGEERTLQVYIREITWGGMPHIMTMYLDITERLKLEARIRYQAELAENTPDAITSGTMDFKVYSWNKGAEQMYGWKAGEVIGKDVLGFIKPSNITISHQDFIKVLREKGFWRGEDIHQRKNGERFPVLMSTSLMKDKNGVEIGTVNVTKDISELRTLEDRVRYHARLLENVSDAIISSDAGLKILSWNKAAEKIYGLTEQEALGRNIREITRPEFVNTTPDEIIAMIKDAGYWKGDAVYRPANREPFHALITATLIKDDLGKELGAVTVIKDITDRIKVEETLRTREAFLDNVIENTPSPLWVSDASGTLIRMNQALRDLLKIRDEDVVGKYNVMEDVQVIEQGFLPLVQNVYREGKTASFTLSYQTARDNALKVTGNQDMVLEIVISAVKDSRGKITHAICQENDITDRIKAEHALQESQQTFFSAFQSSPSLNVIVSLSDRKVIAVNDAACHAIGYQREELIGKSVIDLDIWYDPVQRDALTRELIEKKTLSNREIKFRLRSGEIRLYNTSLAVLMLKNEPFIYTSMIDITDRRVAEEALAASEERYRTSLENMMEGCQIIDRNWRYLYLNDAAVQQSRHKAGELIGHKMAEVYPGIENTEFFAVLKKCMEKRIAYRIENEFTFDDGSSAWFDLSIQPVPEGIFILSLDITEHHRVEAAIHQNEERFRGIFQAGPIGIALSSLEYNFKMANPRFCELFGYPENEIVGKTFRDISFPEDIGKDVASLQRLVSGELPIYSTEKKYKKKNGEIFWGSLTVTMLRDNENKAQGYLAMVEDVTQRRNDQERITHLNLTLRSIRNVNQLITREKNRDRLIQGICDILVASGSFENAWIVLLDDARQPVTLAQSNNRNFISVNLFKNREMPLCAQKALKQKKVVVIEDPYKQCQGCPALGEERNISSMAVRLESEGDIYGVLCASMPRELLASEYEKSLFEEVAEDIAFAFRDISLRSTHDLLQQEQLRAAKLESIGTLAGGIAHDFNNLLTGIMGNIGLAKSFLPPTGNVFEVLDEAEKAAVRSRDLTLQLLTFARGGKPIKKITDITKIIKESATFALRGSKVKLEISIPDNLWLVEADEGQISQVIHNLVINADDAMPHGGTLYITGKNLKLSRAGTLPLNGGNYVEISVRDTGTGISPEHLPQIFEPYFTTKHSGSGLGLTSAYSIIKSHGGSLLVDSVINEGSTFRIYLPASKKTAKGEKKVAATQSTQAGGKVLIMDDDEIIRKMLKNMLNLAGYEVEATADGVEALVKYREAMAANNPFSAVIMDLTVPGGMGGKDAIKELLVIDPKAAVIVSSGYATDPIMSEYKKYGFSAVIAKPYSIKQLQDTISGLASKKK